MTTENIKKELINLMSILFTDNGFDVDIIEYTDLIDDLDMDSITFISLIVEIESLFNIQIPDDFLLMDNFKNINDIIKVVAEQLMNNLSEKEDKCDDETRENA